MRRKDPMVLTFWTGLIFGLLGGAFGGFLFAAVLSGGKRQITAEMACAPLGTEKNPTSIKLIPDEMGDKIATFQ